MRVPLVPSRRDGVDFVRRLLGGFVADDVQAAQDAQDVGIDGDAVIRE